MVKSSRVHRDLIWNLQSCNHFQKLLEIPVVVHCFLWISVEFKWCSTLGMLHAHGHLSTMRGGGNITLIRRYTSQESKLEGRVEKLSGFHPSLIISNSFVESFVCAPAIESSCPTIWTICEVFCVNIVALDPCFTFFNYYIYTVSKHDTQEICQ